MPIVQSRKKTDPRESTHIRMAEELKARHRSSRLMTVNFL